MAKNVVGENIRRIRERLSLTQEELALRCNLSQAHINFMESGKRGYTKDSLAKIAKSLGVQVSELFGEEKAETQHRIAEFSPKYGKSKRWRVYEDIISLLDKLPESVVNHYKMLLSAEVSIRGGKRGK